MLENINHFSILDFLWFNIQPHQVNFGLKGIPSDTHFTIVYDEKHTDLNFHITKNTENLKTKPKITIFKIDKCDLEQGGHNSILGLLQKMLNPVDIEELKTKYQDEIGFISYNDFENTETGILVKQKLIENFQDYLKFKRKRRVKIHGDIEKGFEMYASSEELQASFINNIIDLPTRFSERVEHGMIITENLSIFVIRIDDKWYTINLDLTLLDFIGVFMNAEAANHLIWKTKRALVSIKNSKTYSDVEHLDDPVRIIYVGNQNGSA